MYGRRDLTNALATVAALTGLALGCAGPRVVDMPLHEQNWQQPKKDELALMRDLTECKDQAMIPSVLHRNEDGSSRVERKGYDDDGYVACMESRGWTRNG